MIIPILSNCTACVWVLTVWWVLYFSFHKIEVMGFAVPGGVPGGMSGLLLAQSGLEVCLFWGWVTQPVL
jgi:hypothetical protein